MLELIGLALIPIVILIIKKSNLVTTKKKNKILLNILYTGIILLSSPFCWIILVHFFKMIFQSLRIRKNAIIKKNEEYIYYRGDLDNNYINSSLTVE